jgi:alpha-beta hydrolase superfamily lysophospholipase
VFTAPDWLVSRVTPTDNRAEMLAMSRDPLMVWGARSDALFGLVDTMEAALRDADRLKGGTLWAYGAHDRIIPRNATDTAVKRLGSEVRTACYPAGHHLLLRDMASPVVWADVAAFIRDPVAPLPSGAGPLPCPHRVAGAHAAP